MSSSENVGQEAILSHEFSSFQGVVTRHEGSWENQPRRNEEHEGFYGFFVSSWLIFRSMANE